MVRGVYCKFKCNEALEAKVGGGRGADILGTRLEAILVTFWVWGV